MEDHNTDREMPAAPQKLRQDPKYVAMESLATILVIVGAVLAGKGNTAAMAIVFVIAAFLFLIAALLNIASIKAQRAQMEQAEREHEEKKEEVEEAFAAENEAPTKNTD